MILSHYFPFRITFLISVLSECYCYYTEVCPLGNCNLAVQSNLGSQRLAQLGSSNVYQLCVIRLMLFLNHPSPLPRVVNDPVPGPSWYPRERKRKQFWINQFIHSILTYIGFIRLNVNIITFNHQLVLCGVILINSFYE